MIGAYQPAYLAKQTKAGLLKVIAEQQQAIARLDALRLDLEAKISKLGQSGYVDRLKAQIEDLEDDLHVAEKRSQAESENNLLLLDSAAHEESCHGKGDRFLTCTCKLRSVA